MELDLDPRADTGSTGKVADVLRSVRFRGWVSERDVQGAAWVALASAGMDPLWEYPLGSRCRVDLIVGRVAVEVKVAGTVADLAKQVERYAATGLVDGVVVLTTVARHRTVRGNVGGVRVEVVYVANGSL